MIFRAICICLFCAQVQALPITIDPDDYSPGSVLPQDLGAAIRFIHLEDGASEFTYSDAVVTDCSLPANLACHAITGENALGTPVVGDGPVLARLDHFPRTPEEIRISQFATALLIEFDNPTDSWSAQLNSNSGDTVVAVAYSKDGLVVGRSEATMTRRDWFGPGFLQDIVCNISFSSLSPDVATIVLGSNSAAAYVDSITYNRIPEPSSLALLSAGLLGLLGKRRSAGRRRREGDAR